MGVFSLSLENATSCGGSPSRAEGTLSQVIALFAVVVEACAVTLPVVDAARLESKARRRASLAVQRAFRADRVFFVVFVLWLEPDLCQASFVQIRKPRLSVERRTENSAPLWRSWSSREALLRDEAAARRGSIELSVSVFLLVSRSRFQFPIWTMDSVCSLESR